MYTELVKIKILFLQRGDLRELESKFLVIPPQVVRVEVSGLQEFQHTEILLNQINRHLLGKPLAAVVENRAQLGRRVSSEDEELPKLIFFDTSTEDIDINLNQKLIEFIGKQSTLLTAASFLS